MKAIIFILAALAQLLLVAAQPHDIVTDTVTVTAVGEIVWVDEQGKVVSTEYKTSGYTTPTVSAISSPPPPPPPSPPTTAPSVAAETPEAEYVPSSKPAPPVENPPPPPTTAAPPTPPPASTPSYSPSPGAGKSPSAPNTHADSSAKLGITYSPYTPASGCKSSSQIASDLAPLLAAFSLIRLYDVDCNQVSAVAAAISGTSTSLFLGLVGLSDLDAKLASMAAQLSHDWSAVDTVSIGNELINSGRANVSDVVAALGHARAVLRPLGYAGPIVTVDTFDQLTTHPALCGASDYCAANCHAYFDDANAAGNAGAYVAAQAAAVARLNPGKRTVITESGWPHAGAPNGAAAASLPAQAQAIASLKAAFPAGGLVLFSAYDDRWKPPGPYAVEQSFGIYGH